MMEEDFFKSNSLVVNRLTYVQINAAENVQSRVIIISISVVLNIRFYKSSGVIIGL